jgi:16S rRNA (guanine1516-N2)-methyltransferase
VTSDGVARVVARDSPAHLELLAELGIEFDACPPEEAFVLVEREGRLDLRPPGEAAASGIHAQFPPDQGRPSGGRNPLVRAFGKSIDTIFDLTAGLGSDAYRLAEAGHRVVGCERHPAVYAVLITGWMRDCAIGRVPAEVAERIEFRHAESADLLARIEDPKTGVYLDPMYPLPRRSKALPRRELQVLRQLLGAEEDSASIVEAARLVSARVVVKRPHRAPPLVSGVSFEIATKLVRFDVYVNIEKMGAPRHE